MICNINCLSQLSKVWAECINSAVGEVKEFSGGIDERKTEGDEGVSAASDYCVY